jgi:glucose-6-phosphate-specific signal transduction histidine kinase
MLLRYFLFYLPYIVSLLHFSLNFLQLYDISAQINERDDIAVILLNSRATLACLTRKERKKLWLMWSEKILG